jgi:hypothetical protein
MRSRYLLVVLALAALPGSAMARAAKGPIRCCLELKTVPTLPPGPICAELSARRPKIACRLMGGRPVGRGDCSPTVCSSATAK